MARDAHARALVRLDDAVQCGASVDALTLTAWAHDAWVGYRVAIRAADAKAVADAAKKRGRRR